MISIPPHRPTGSLTAPAPPGTRPAFLRILGRTASAWLNDNCMKMAAALACYAVLSLAPLTVISFKIVSVIFQGQHARQMMIHQLQILMGSAVSPELIDNILDSSRQGTGWFATSVSIAVILFGASGVFGELQNSMNLIWQVTLKTNSGIWGWIRGRFFAVLAVLGLGLLLLLWLIASVGVTTGSRVIRPTPSTAQY